MKNQHMTYPKLTHFSTTTLCCLLLLLLLSPPLPLATSASPKHPPRPRNEVLLRHSCLHASYPSLCLHTLSYAAPHARSTADLALAAVSVSLRRARRVSAFASHLARSTPSAPRHERSALQDCVEQLSDSADELADTLSELRHLRSATFRWQMSDAETWVSAALTNEDTCLDGFEGIDGGLKRAVRRKIFNVARVTSNALYLINRLAAARPASAAP